VNALELEDLTVRFGSVVAVDGLSLTAREGEITALIGPNGAGKTTTFNACCGLLRPATGRVVLLGEDVSDLPPAARARKGLGRSFQRLELFDSMTVDDNVALGLESGLAGKSWLRCLVGTRKEAAQVAAAVEESLETCGITDLRERRAGELSTGQRRLVELARALAGGFPVLLLDEPSSGLDHDETERFGQVLRQIVDERGCGILLVEHDMSLVMEVCEHIYVLDFGRVLFEGSPNEVAASPVVRAAYLGDDDPVLAPLEEGVL
jgi:ABC-type branched-subunit amino acid transport system ATPase component